MKNKLLLSTAIASVALMGAAHAETKVSGNMEQTFNADSRNGSNSARGLGTEANIGLSSSAELDNGMSASFGFNLEANGETTKLDSTYLTLGFSDAVSMSIARDNGNNLSGSAVPHVSDTASTVVGGAYSNTGITTNADGVTASRTGKRASDGHNSEHIRLDMNAVGGTLTARYAPSSGDTSPAHNAAADANNAIQEILYKGSIGIDGLGVVIGTSKEDGQSGETDGKFRKAGVSYNFGSFAVGVESAKGENAGQAIGAEEEIEMKSAGITFAVSDNLTLGLNRYETERTDSGTKDPQDETTTMVGVGYSLGGIAIDINYASVENFNNGTEDTEHLAIRTIQKF